MGEEESAFASQRWSNVTKASRMALMVTCKPTTTPVRHHFGRTPAPHLNHLRCQQQDGRQEDDDLQKDR